METISILMGVYREKKEYLAAALSSLQEQTYSDLEILIYIDGKQPGVEKYLESCAKKDPRIRLLYGETTQGLAHGLNQCINAATGKYFARMDSDDTCNPERLREQILFLEEHPELDFAGCDTYLLDEKEAYAIRRLPTFPKPEDFYGFLPFIHPSVVFRREIFDEGFRYPEDPKTLRCEDMAFFMELYAAGKRGGNLHDPLYTYREDRAGYKKKKYKYRMLEAGVRRRGFKAMGLPTGKSVIYTIKPLIVGLVPGWLAAALKHRRDAGKR